MNNKKPCYGCKHASMIKGNKVNCKKDISDTVPDFCGEREESFSKGLRNLLGV